MKGKKMVFMALAALVIAVFPGAVMPYDATLLQAAGWISGGSVTLAGPDGVGATTVTMFQIKVGTAAPLYYKAKATTNGSLERQLLAVALTAEANGKKVRFYQTGVGAGTYASPIELKAMQMLP